MIVGLYVPGDSVLHRLDAGAKILLLMGLAVGLVLTSSPQLLSAVLAGIGLSFVGIAGLGTRRLWQATRPLIIWLVFIGVAQTILAGGETALIILLRLLALVWASVLVTLTTRLTDMTDRLVSVCRWLRPLGVSPNRVAFMISLTLRLIPALGDVVQEVRDAQRARGLERSLIAAAVPVLIRVFRQADAMSEALLARGYDRWDEESP